MGKRAEFSERGTRSTGTQRMRIYSLHEDQIEVIRCALELARCQANTEYDAVALTNICLTFLTDAQPVKAGLLPCS